MGIRRAPGRDGRARRLRVCVAAAAGLILTGCTVIHIDGAGPASVRFGVLRIAPAVPHGIVAVRSVGFGIVPGPAGATLGFARSSLAFADDTSQCRAIVFEWPRDPAAAVALGALAGDPSLCIVGEKAR